ncbi:MAG: hypothetical protein ACOCSK_03280 [Rhodothermales bacterium]
MLFKASGEYQAGGYLVPLYSGAVEVSFNAKDHEEAEDVAELRLRQNVSRRSCMDLRMVRVSDIRVTAAE